MTRIEALRKRLPADFEAALVQNTYNRSYLTGMQSSAGTVIVTRENAYLIIDFRYIEAARAKAKGVEVIQQENLYAQIGDILRKEGVTTVLVENETTVGNLTSVKKGVKGFKFKCSDKLSGAIHALRAVKDEGEIAAIQAAQDITDAAFSYILGFIKPGQTEREIAAELEYFMRRNGADGLAFSTICVAGAKTSLPHGVPGENVVKDGDFVTMDFGALKDGYCSDMTRTIAVGHVSDEQKKVYATVLEAHLAACEAAVPGITGAELDAIARDIIYDAGYEGCFGHGLGHSLGLEIHEEPRASMLGKKAFEPNMVLTIEPGIYLEGQFGVRIENMVRFTETGNINMTNSARELIIL